MVDENTCTRALKKNKRATYTCVDKGGVRTASFCIISLLLFVGHRRKRQVNFSVPSAYQTFRVHCTVGERLGYFRGELCSARALSLPTAAAGMSTRFIPVSAVLAGRKFCPRLQYRLRRLRQTAMHRESVMIGWRGWRPNFTVGERHAHTRTSRCRLGAIVWVPREISGTFLRFMLRCVHHTGSHSGKCPDFCMFVFAEARCLYRTLAC